MIGLVLLLAAQPVPVELFRDYADCTFARQTCEIARTRLEGDVQSCNQGLDFCLQLPPPAPPLEPPPSTAWEPWKVVLLGVGVGLGAGALGVVIGFVVRGAGPT